MLEYIKNIVRNQMDYESYLIKKWKKQNQFFNTPFEFGCDEFNSKPKVGILFDIAQEHQFYIKACLQAKINYEVIDIRADDWTKRIKQSGCDVFLAWPTIYKPIQKGFWDERLNILEKILNKKVFPSFDLLWVYESKRRTRDWLMINNYPHPKTYIFFNKDEATQFVDKTKFPVILKTDQGAASSGVFIIRTSREAKKFVKKAFSRGINLKNKSSNDFHQGYIIFQEYLPNCNEWRIINVGDSYFCRFKIKKGDFHSGSGAIIWAKPPRELLDLTKEISSLFKVPNINVDFFETEDGRYLINEIHALWGGKVIKDEDLEGRYIYNDIKDEWQFENGDFFGSRCAELRIQWLIDNKWL